MSLLLWLVLAFFSWPLALLALLLWPIGWALGLPLRVVGISGQGVLGVLESIITLPGRLAQGPR